MHQDPIFIEKASSRVDDINPGVPLKGSIRVPLRGSHKGIDRVLGFRVMISILHYLKDPRLWEFW